MKEIKHSGSIASKRLQFAGLIARRGALAAVGSTLLLMGCEPKTTVVNPESPKSETTIVNPPAEKKTETNTTVTTQPGGGSTKESTTTTTNP